MTSDPVYNKMLMQAPSVLQRRISYDIKFHRNKITTALTTGAFFAKSRLLYEWLRKYITCQTSKNF